MVADIRQGDIFWIDLGPARGSAPADRRPCVVVQGDRFNRSRIQTTIVCVITSNLDRANAPGNVSIDRGDGNLPKPSIVNVSQVITVDKAELGDRLGRLDGGTTERILLGLATVFERSRRADA